MKRACFDGKDRKYVEVWTCLQFFFPASDFHSNSHDSFFVQAQRAVSWSGLSAVGTRLTGPRLSLWLILYRSLLALFFSRSCSTAFSDFSLCLFARSARGSQRGRARRGPRLPHASVRVTSRRNASSLVPKTSFETRGRVAAIVLHMTVKARSKSNNVLITSTTEQSLLIRVALDKGKRTKKSWTLRTYFLN